MHRPFVGIFLLLNWLAIPLQAAEPRVRLHSEERKKVDAAIVGYRKAQDDAERLAQIDKAAAASEHALDALDDLVSRELVGMLQKYRASVGRAATQIYAQRLSKDAVPEIVELQKKVLDQASGKAELTKESIVQNSNPAIKRLKEIVLLDRKTVVEENPTLLKLREGLAPAGERWQRVREHQTRLDNEARKAAPANTEMEPEPKAVPPTFEAYLTADEIQIIGLALPLPDETRAILAMNASYEAKLDPEEYRCIREVNLTRILLGLNCLQIDLNLVQAARDHSQDMARLKFFSHTSPVANKNSPGDRAKNFGTSAHAENIAAGARDGIQANGQWWHSPGHHKNLLGQHQRIGVGRSGQLWTEMFGG